MDKLPEETFHHFFYYLDLIDLSNCKLVNKQFYKNLKSYRIKELNIDCDCFNMIIPHPVNRIYKMYLFQNELLFNFDFLKRLQIRIEDYDEDCREDYPLKCVNFIQKLSKNLEQLEIENWSKICPTSLDLPKLKVLYFIDKYYQSELNLEINAPNLETISVDNFSQNNFLKIKDPLSVKYLHQRYYDLKVASIFKNLESISFYSYLNEELSLSLFPKLKNIMCEPDEKKENILVPIIEERKRTGSKFKIYCNGLEINKLDDLNGSNISPYDLLNKDYDQIGFNRELIEEIDYTELMKGLKNKRNGIKFLKFEYIKRINIDGRVEDQDALIEFIKKCLNLTDLYIKISKLRQDFYDQLPSISSLKHLEIYEGELDQPLNFDFIRRMFNLQDFRTDQQLNLNENFELNGLKYIDLMDFKINNKEIELRKRDNLYSFYINGRWKAELSKLNQVIEMCKKIQEQ